MTTWNHISGIYAYHQRDGYGGCLSYTVPVCDPVWTQNFQNFYTRTSRTLCGIFAGYTYHEVTPLHRLRATYQDDFWEAATDLLHDDTTSNETRAFLHEQMKLKGYTHF
mgnify:CR=1 FL=1